MNDESTNKDTSFSKLSMAEQQVLKDTFAALQSRRNAANPIDAAANLTAGFFKYPDKISSTDYETMRRIRTAINDQCGGVFPNLKHPRIRAFHAALKTVFLSEMKLKDKKLYKILTWNSYHEEIRQRIMKDKEVENETIRDWMLDVDLMYVAERNAVSDIERAVLQGLCSKVWRAATGSGSNWPTKSSRRLLSESSTWPRRPR